MLWKGTKIARKIFFNSERRFYATGFEHWLRGARRQGATRALELSLALAERAPGARWTVRPTDECTSAPVSNLQSDPGGRHRRPGEALPLLRYHNHPPHIRG